MVRLAWEAFGVLLTQAAGLGGWGSQLSWRVFGQFIWSTSFWTAAKPKSACLPIARPSV